MREREGERERSQNEREPLHLFSLVVAAPPSQEARRAAMVVFHSIHSDYHKEVVRKQEKAAKRAAARTSGSTAPGRLPSIAGAKGSGKKVKKKGKGKKSASSSASKAGAGGERAPRKTPRIYPKSGQGKPKVTRAKRDADFVEVIEVPSDVPIRLVPLNTPRKPKKKVKKTKKKKGQAADSPVLGKPSGQRQGADNAEVDELLHQLNLERKKCHVLSQIVQEQGAFLETIQREKATFAEHLHQSASPSKLSRLGSDFEDGSENGRESYDSESVSPRHGMKHTVTDAINVLHLMEKEGERTRGELNELRRMARTFHDELERSQRAEAAALEALSVAQAKVSEAETQTKQKKMKKLGRMVSKLDATLTPTQSNEISILSGLATSESAASPAVTADHRHDYQDSESQSVSVKPSAKKKVDRLYKKYLDENDNREVQRPPAVMTPMMSRASSAGSVVSTTAKKRRPRRSPQVGPSHLNFDSPQLGSFHSSRNGGTQLIFQNSPAKVEASIHSLERTLETQHKTLEESKRIIGDALLHMDARDDRESSLYNHQRLEVM